jgi:hypothetical protein
LLSRDLHRTGGHVLTKTILALPSLAILLPTVALSQTSPFLPDAVHRALVNEISGDRSFEHLRHLTQYHRTAPGRDFWAAVEYIRASAEGAGLEDVRVIRQPWSGRPWSCHSAEAWLRGPEPVKFADFDEVAVSVADHSRTTHVSAPLVDVGNGTSEDDFADLEVEGRIVLAAGHPYAVMREAVWRRGALGVVSYASNRLEPFDAPDQVAWARIPYEARGVGGVKDGTPGTFAIMVSPRRGQWLREQLAAAGEPLEVRIDIEAEHSDQREQGMVEAWIRGSEIHDQQIVLVSHIQEEKTSANDDGSGCANMLEIGRALARLVREGQLPRPRRDIRFWWVNELSSEPRYFKDHPETPGRMLLALNQDMVGARQSWGGRVQYASRLPWSLPHALDDVLESILGAVRDGNTSYLVNRRTGQPQPFLEEVRAVKGSREPFHARMVPYFDSTDHHAFTPRHVGVPGASLTNWPDQWIHSSGDDLENVDATQLERNALVVAAVALYFAALEDDGVPGLAAYVAARGRARVAGDAATAVAHLVRAGNEGGVAAAWSESRALVVQSHEREERALASLAPLDPGGRSGEVVDAARRQLRESRQAEIVALERAYVGLTGAPPPSSPPDETAREMAEIVYVPQDDVVDLHAKLREIATPGGLHQLMEFEILNFADGKRTAWEVYEAVAAEALSAGAWYYGTVSPAQVKAVLDSGVKAGAYTRADR